MRKPQSESDRNPGRQTKPARPISIQRRADDTAGLVHETQRSISPSKHTRRNRRGRQKTLTRASNLESNTSPISVYRLSIMERQNVTV